MSENEKKPKEMSDGARFALIGTIITAVIGLIGTGLTLYFNYLEKIEPQKIALHATQSAEARIPLTTFSLMPTFPDTLTYTATREITSTFTITDSPSPLLPSLTFTTTPATSASGIKYCVDTPSLNVRSGPGLYYTIMGGLLQNTCLFFDGRLEDPENKWVRISPGQEGLIHLGGLWVYGGYLRPQDFERLPIIPPPPPPPTPSPTPAG
jgi:hypothetical protein